MSLLQKFVTLPQEQQQRLLQFYRNVGFPQDIDFFLVRQKCADWIEANIWNNDFNPDIRTESGHEEKIREWFTSFCVQLQASILEAENEPLKVALRYILSNLLPMHLYTVLRNCLNEERLTHARMRTDKIVFLQQQIMEVMTWSAERVEIGNSLVMEETHLTQLIEWGNSIDHPSDCVDEMRQIDRSIKQRRVDYSGLERKINEMIGNLLQEAEQLLANLIDEHGKLVLVKKPQEFLEQLGVSYDDFFGNVLNLKEILHQIDKLITSVIQSSHQPTVPTFVEQSHNVGRLLVKITPLFNTLFVHSMSLVKHPDSIIKQEKKFDIELCCFAPKTLNLTVDTFPTVTVCVVNETDAANLCRNRSPHPDCPRPCGGVTYEKCGHIFDERLSRLTTSLTDIKVPTRPSDVRNKPIPVLRQKFYLFFYFDVVINDRPYTMWTLSFPFVYTTNASQILEASRTIFWDTYLKGLDPFNIPDEIPVHTMTQALSNYIQKETGTTLALTERQRNYLAQKMLQAEIYSNETIVSRNQFEHVKDRMTNGTFWEWFHYSVKLIKDHLSPYWGNGYIAGFMDRQETEELLHRYGMPGVFVLRFSDSCRYGGLSITWYEHGAGPCSVQPLTDKCFLIRSLTERLNDITNFTEVMYPNESMWIRASKQNAFPCIEPTVNPPTENLEPLYRRKKTVKPYIRTGMVWRLLHFGLALNPNQQQMEFNCRRETAT